jgi:hypothetical protein
MSLHEFITSVRAGSLYFGPSEVSTDSPALDPPEMRRTLASAAIWLTPSSVAGYDDSDFGFMDPRERAELREAVQGFLAVAQQVPPKTPASREQYEEGRRWFSKVLEIVRPDLCADAETFRASKVLRSVLGSPTKPDSVVDLDYHIGRDSTGDPAVWIWVIIPDEVAESPRFFEITEELAQYFEVLLKHWDISFWPYIHFRTVSEQAELQTASPS